MTAPRDIALDKTLASLERIGARAAEEYMAACRLHRYGSTPTVRAAALATARRLRPLVHPGVADWRARHPSWQCPECGADRGDGYCQECGQDRDE